MLLARAQILALLVVIIFVYFNGFLIQDRINGYGN